MNVGTITKSGSAESNDTRYEHAWASNVKVTQGHRKWQGSIGHLRLAANEVRRPPVRKMCLIFGDGVNRPCDLDL